MIQDVPSIYNQPSVYNQAGGETIPTIPEDIGTKGKVFKNFFPIKQYSHSLFDEDFILLGSAFTSGDPLVLNGTFTFASTDVVEIQFRVSKPNFSGKYNTFFGVSDGDYSKNISMDFGNVSPNNDKSIFFGIPESTNSSSWSHPLSVGNLNLTANKFYTINGSINLNGPNIATLSITDDDSLKSNSVTIANLQGSGQLQLQGLRRWSDNHFNGSIDMANSYIRKNGVTLWGVVE